MIKISHNTDFHVYNADKPLYLHDFQNYKSSLLIHMIKSQLSNDRFCQLSSFFLF